jgi:hypothetical protein
VALRLIDVQVKGDAHEDADINIVQLSIQPETQRQGKLTLKLL